VGNQPRYAVCHTLYGIWIFFKAVQEVYPLLKLVILFFVKITSIIQEVLEDSAKEKQKNSSTKLYKNFQPKLHAKISLCVDHVKEKCHLNL
jgi:hypothetical protein